MSTKPPAYGQEQQFRSTSTRRLNCSLERSDRSLEGFGRSKEKRLCFRPSLANEPRVARHCVWGLFVVVEIIVQALNERECPLNMVSVHTQRRHGRKKLREPRFPLTQCRNADRPSVISAHCIRRSPILQRLAGEGKLFRCSTKQRKNLERGALCLGRLDLFPRCDGRSVKAHRYRDRKKRPSYADPVSGISNIHRLPFPLHQLHFAHFWEGSNVSRTAYRRAGN